MRRTVLIRANVALVLCTLAFVATSPETWASGGTALSRAEHPPQQVDLALALDGSGAFRGAPRLAGAIDMSAWSFISDLEAGEPPRFTPRYLSIQPASGTGPWSPVGPVGTTPGPALNNGVYALAVSGIDLYVGGHFIDAGGNTEADRIAKWDGSTWSNVGALGADGALNNDVFALAVSGDDLYAGGSFTDAQGILAADYVAKWNGSTWSALGSSGPGLGALNGQVNAIAVSDENLFVGGRFTNAAGHAAADYIARWSGSGWSALGSSGGQGALNDYVTALAVSGPDLFVGGRFVNASTLPAADYVARWSGTSWSALGAIGSGNGALNGYVYALAASGPNLVVGGAFLNAGAIAEADDIAMWSGNAWSALGSNGPGHGALTNAVLALAVSGDDLYAGGQFVDAAGIPTADFIARWNGHAWSAVGSNGSGDGAITNQYVYAMAVRTSSLMVGGWFINVAGNGNADYLAKWALGTPVRRPDGRIRLGTGPVVGNDIYNTSGAGQSRTGSAAPSGTITFGISIDNDGTGIDGFSVKATGASAATYTVRYFHGTTDITSGVVAGTYETPALLPGGTYLISARVTVKAAAAVGSMVKRLVALSSVGNPARKDSVEFVAKRG